MVLACGVRLFRVLCVLALPKNKRFTIVFWCGNKLFCKESEIGANSFPKLDVKMGLKSKAFAVGFVVFLVVLVFRLLVGALHSLSNAQSINKNSSVAGLQPETQPSPTLSVLAAFASVIVFFSGLKLFFKKSPDK